MLGCDGFEVDSKATGVEGLGFWRASHQRRPGERTDHLCLSCIAASSRRQVTIEGFTIELCLNLIGTLKELCFIHNYLGIVKALNSHA
jgi:hypothetical protein